MSERPNTGSPHQDIWKVDVSGYRPEIDGDSGEDRNAVGESYFVDHDIPSDRLSLHQEGTGNKWIGYPPRTAASYADGYDQRDEDYNGEPDQGIYWAGPAQQQYVNDELGSQEMSPEPAIGAGMAGPGSPQDDFAQAIMARLHDPGYMPVEATSMSGRPGTAETTIDGHGDAPHHGADPDHPRAAGPDAYDAESTEGQGDSKWDDALPGIDKKDANGAQIGMYPEGMSSGGGPGLEIGAFTAALSPDEHAWLLGHMRDGHGYPEPVISRWPPKDLAAEHSFMHFDPDHGADHSHGPDYEYNPYWDETEGSSNSFVAVLADRHEANMPWTDHERTELHNWSTGKGATEGDFVPSYDFTNKVPTGYPDPYAEEPGITAEGSYLDDPLAHLIQMHSLDPATLQPHHRHNPHGLDSMHDRLHQEGIDSGRQSGMNHAHDRFLPPWDLTPERLHGQENRVDHAAPMRDISREYADLPGDVATEGWHSAPGTRQFGEPYLHTLSALAGGELPDYGNEDDLHQHLSWHHGRGDLPPGSDWVGMRNSHDDIHRRLEQGIAGSGDVPARPHVHDAGAYPQAGISYQPYQSPRWPKNYDRARPVHDVSAPWLPGDIATPEQHAGTEPRRGVPMSTLSSRHREVIAARFIREGSLARVQAEDVENVRRGTYPTHRLNSFQGARAFLLSVAAKKGTDPEEVHRQLSEDYPPEAIEWVRHVPWTGPEPVAAHDIDWNDRKSWTAYHQPAKVARFSRKMVRGKKLKPAITVQRPGASQVITDGHHRGLSALLAGQPVLAYIAHPDQVQGPWDEMHGQQVHASSKADPTASSTGPDAPELEVKSYQDSIEKAVSSLGRAPDTDDANSLDAPAAPDTLEGQQAPGSRGCAGRDSAPGDACRYFRRYPLDTGHQYAKSAQIRSPGSRLYG